jgi:hypothetical protein
MTVNPDNDIAEGVARIATDIDDAFRRMDDPLVEIARLYGPEVLAGALTNYLCCVLAGSPSDRRSLLVGLTCEKIARQTDKLAKEVERMSPHLNYGSERLQ